LSSPASLEGSDRLRLFCALRLPGDVVEQLVSWQAKAFSDADVRILPEDHLHITLAFLGSRPRSDVEPVANAVREAARAAGVPILGVRRYRETVRVAMLVLQDQLVPGDASIGRANELAGDLMLRLEALGVYRRERRDWLPHVTVARFRTQPRLAPELPDLGPFSPSEVALYSSVLRPTGARYEVLESCSLEARVY
jgi:RNA 2',3'-cyclic 3'-phosphodiesterase